MLGLRGRVDPAVCVPVDVQTESLRGSRQYGSDVPVSELPCSGLGARADLAAMAAETGFLMPTDTFSGKTSFQVRRQEGAPMGLRRAGDGW